MWPKNKPNAGRAGRIEAHEVWFEVLVGRGRAKRCLKVPFTLLRFFHKLTRLIAGNRMDLISKTRRMEQQILVFTR